MTDSARTAVIGVGELLWDCFADSRRPGGAPANVAFHARQLGLDGVVCSRVGRDELGDELVRYLVARGLDARPIQRDEQHPTGTVTVNTDRADHPTYVIHENVAWDHLQFDHVWSGLFAAAAAVCFGTLAQRSPDSRTALARGLAAAKAALRVYDVNLRPPWFTRDVIEASLRRAQVVKLNRAELSTLAGLLELEQGAGLGGPALQVDDAARFAAALRGKYGVELVCVTRGKEGCLLISGSEHVDVPGRPVRVADAVGAGDAFTAALTLGLLRAWPLERTARFANEVGALVASRHGAMPTLPDELAVLQASLREELERGQR